VWESQENGSDSRSAAFFSGSMTTAFAGDLFLEAQVGCSLRAYHIQVD